MAINMMGYHSEPTLWSAVHPFMGEVQGMCLNDSVFAGL